CCTCAAPIEPNSRGQCFDCIRAEVDICAGVSKVVALDRCSVCGAFHRNPQWIQIEPESPEMLAMCLKKTHGLDGPTDTQGTSTCKLIDAAFIWTESHCKRLKVKVTLRGEVAGGIVLEQQCVIEYVLRGGQCKACERNASKQTW
ncbi:NMD3 family-domain-containing protein, partial [Pavlovales sp. CCMP2436]